MTSDLLTHAPSLDSHTPHPLRGVSRIGDGIKVVGDTSQVVRYFLLAGEMERSLTVDWKLYNVAHLIDLSRLIITRRENRPSTSHRLSVFAKQEDLSTPKFPELAILLRCSNFFSNGISITGKNWKKLEKTHSGEVSA